MFGNLGNIMGMMGKVREMQANMQEAQQDLAAMRLEHADSENRVSVTLTGQLDVLSVTIAPAALRLAAPELSVLVTQVVREALDKARIVAAERMKRAAGDVDLGAFQNLLR